MPAPTLARCEPRAPSRRRTFWTTKPDARVRMLCDQPCGVPGLVKREVVDTCPAEQLGCHK